MTAALVGDITHLLVVFIVAYCDVGGLLQIPQGYEPIRIQNLKFSDGIKTVQNIYLYMLS